MESRYPALLACCGPTAPTPVLLKLCQLWSKILCPYLSAEQNLYLARFGKNDQAIASLALRCLARLLALKVIRGVLGMTPHGGPTTFGSAISFAYAGKTAFCLVSQSEHAGLDAEFLPEAPKDAAILNFFKKLQPGMAPAELFSPLHAWLAYEARFKAGFKTHKAAHKEYFIQSSDYLVCSTWSNGEDSDAPSPVWLDWREFMPVSCPFSGLDAIYACP